MFRFGLYLMLMMVIGRPGFSGLPDTCLFSELSLTTVSIHGKAGQIPFQLEFENGDANNLEEQSTVEYCPMDELYRLSVPVKAFDGKNRSVEFDFQQLLNYEVYSSIWVEVPENLLLLDERTKKNCQAEIKVFIAGNSTIVPVSYSWHEDEKGRRVFCGTSNLLLSDFHLAPEKKILGLLKISDLIFINFELSGEDLFFIEPN